MLLASRLMNKFLFDCLDFSCTLRKHKGDGKYLKGVRLAAIRGRVVIVVIYTLVNIYYFKVDRRLALG